MDSYTCFDVAMEAYGREVPINASILPGTHLCGTRDIKDIISCMGGIQVLFPLFIQFDLSDSSENEGSNGRSVNIAEEENGIRSYSRMPLTSELVASLLRLIGEFVSFFFVSMLSSSLIFMLFVSGDFIICFRVLAVPISFASYNLPIFSLSLYRWHPLLSLSV